jgi:CDP-glucose 4,6-dehydratase
LKSIFKGKKVIITGHTGFKGSWLSIWLTTLGATVIGVSNSVPSEPSHFESAKLDAGMRSYWVDIRDFNALKQVVKSEMPDFIFHFAAQALVQQSYISPLETFTTNALGTAHLLDSLRHSTKLVIAILITSDKVYHNKEWFWGYRENDPIGGTDPYSASKGMAELIIQAYKASYFTGDSDGVRLAVTRAGNVIGGGDWASNRLVPDCVRAWAKNEIAIVRSPYSTRPWQHVLEPLSGYLSLAIELYGSNKLHGEAYNFGPAEKQDASVATLVDGMKRHWHSVSWKQSAPIESPPEAVLLKLNCDKASLSLGWRPTLDFEETVEYTVKWYRHFYRQQPISMLDFSLQQIDDFSKLAAIRNLHWAKYD